MRPILVGSLLADMAAPLLGRAAYAFVGPSPDPLPSSAPTNIARKRSGPCSWKICNRACNSAGSIGGGPPSGSALAEESAGELGAASWWSRALDPLGACAGAALDRLALAAAAI